MEAIFIHIVLIDFLRRKSYFLVNDQQKIISCGFFFATQKEF